MKRKSIIFLCAVTTVCGIMYTSCADFQGSKSAVITNATTLESTQIGNSTTAATQTADTSATAAEYPNQGSLTTEGQVSAAIDMKQKAVAGLAESLIGSSFKYGCAGPTEFDNSGFIVYCFAQNGVTLPRQTHDIVNQGVHIEKSYLKPGDVVFFYNDNPGSAEFAGICIGNDQFIACCNENDPVTIYSLSNPYFIDHFVCARRYFGSGSAARGDLSTCVPQQILGVYTDCLQRGDYDTFRQLYSENMKPIYPLFAPQTVYDIQIGKDKINNAEFLANRDTSKSYLFIEYAIKNNTISGSCAQAANKAGDDDFSFFIRLVKENNVWKIDAQGTGPS